MDLGKGIKDGGGYDLSEIAMAEEALDSGRGGKKEEFQEVEPMYIEVKDGNVVRTEEYEARMVIVEYDEYDEIVGVELL